jgi:Uracil DNA glycosylase superfamily
MKKREAKIGDDHADDWRPAPVPETSSLRAVAKAARSCTACPLYKRATQTVFGEGPKNARLMLLGEQPGDQEDLAGKPFVGPAGKLLERALEKVGINREGFTSPMPSNILSGNRAGSGAFIKSRIRAKSRLAVHGWRPNCDSLGRRCSFVSRRLRPNQFSARHFA